MKKILIYALAALMLLGTVGMLASCGEPERVEATIVDGKYDPPINITWACPFIGINQGDIDKHPNNWTTADNDWTRLARDEYGINMELIWDVAEWGVYRERLNGQILAGQIPDFLNLGPDEGENKWATTYVKRLYEQDLIVPMTEEIQTYSHERYLEMLNNLGGDEALYAFTYNGEVYALPQIGYGNGSNTVYWIRQDWLNAVGKEVPTNYNELIDVIKAFTTGDPDKDGQDNTFGLAINVENAGVKSNLFFNGWGAFPGIWLENEETGKLEYGSIQPEMKDAIGALRELFTGGYIVDLDTYASALNDGFYMCMTNGQCGVIEATSNYLQRFTGMKLMNPEFELIPTTGFSANGEEFKLTATGSHYRAYVVSTNCASPAVAVILMNMFMDCGERAETDMAVKEQYMYSADGSSHYYNFAPAITEYSELGSNQHEIIKEALETGDTSGLTTQGQVQIYNYVKKYLDQEGRDYINYWYWERMYGVDGAAGVYETDPEAVRDLFQGASTDTMILKLDDLTAALNVAVNEIITGVQELEYFDVAIQQWLEQGGQAITDEVNAWYDLVKGNA